MGTQFFALVVSSVGIIVIFSETEVHFNTKWHSQLGIAVFGLAWTQAVGGILRPHAPEGWIYHSANRFTNLHVRRQRSQCSAQDFQYHSPPRWLNVHSCGYCDYFRWHWTDWVALLGGHFFWSLNWNIHLHCLASWDDANLASINSVASDKR